MRYPPPAEWLPPSKPPLPLPCPLSITVQCPTPPTELFPFFASNLLSLSAFLHASSSCFLLPSSSISSCSLRQNFIHVLPGVSSCRHSKRRHADLYFPQRGEVRALERGFLLPDLNQCFASQKAWSVWPYCSDDQPPMALLPNPFESKQQPTHTSPMYQNCTACKAVHLRVSTGPDLPRAQQAEAAKATYRKRAHS